MRTRFFGGALTLWYLLLAACNAFNPPNQRDKTSNDSAAAPTSGPKLRRQQTIDSTEKNAVLSGDTLMTDTGYRNAIAR